MEQNLYSGDWQSVLQCRNEDETTNGRAHNVCRPGCKDIWNAFMCEGAKFGAHDVSFCPTTAKTLPDSIVTWDETKTIYNKKLVAVGPEFREDSFVCWYVDDYKFDGRQGVWDKCKKTLKLLRHFAGVITPDFSTYQDFPEPLKLYNTYRMRLLGYWFGKNGIPVVNNVRWGTRETYGYCFEGVPKNSIVAVSACGGSTKKLENRERFENGLDELVKVLSPHTIIVYGSANYPCFDRLIDRGVKIASYPSKMERAFKGRKRHE